MNIKPQISPTNRTGLATHLECLNAGLEQLDEFARRTEQLSDALAQLEQVAGEAAKRPLHQLQRELKDFEPAVTFLGQVKSGKTTLVNALAGWPDLLPTDVNPWTSVVTSLHLTPGSQRRDVGARFQLMQEHEWDRLLHKGGRLGELADRAGAGGELEKIRTQIEVLREKSRRRLGKKFELLLGQVHEYGYFDKNLLERYICLGDDFATQDEAEEGENQGRFADITRSADLYLHCQSKPLQMCLRDTPGVNDTFMMREQVTIHAVRESRICVVVLSAHQALTSIDMGLIRLVSTLKSRDVIIFVNRIDELRDPSEQIPEIEKSIRGTLERHDGPQDAQIIFGSAYWANKVLSESLDEMPESSAATLLKWAELELAPTDPDYSAAEMIWHLSGLPKLQEVMAERIVTSLGNAKLDKIASSALTVATGQQAANKIRIEGEATDANMSMQQVRVELDALAHQHLEELSETIDQVTAVFQSRADKAHANFVERATHSLIKHLEKQGEGEVWSYEPTGLRMLLKSAYSVFSARAHNAANKQYEAAVADIAGLYFRAFGKTVEGIQLSVPEAPRMPAPVTIAQTIALDFNDSWWVSWWKRTRGYQAFAKRFRALITAETEDFMAQLKTVQPDDIQEQMKEILQSFIEQNRDILFEIGGSFGDKDGLQRLYLGKDECERLEQIEVLLDELRSYAADPNKEAIS